MLEIRQRKVIVKTLTMDSMKVYTYNGFKNIKALDDCEVYLFQNVTKARYQMNKTYGHDDFIYEIDDVNIASHKISVIDDDWGDDDA